MTRYANLIGRSAKGNVASVLVALGRDWHMCSTRRQQMIFATVRERETRRGAALSLRRLAGLLRQPPHRPPWLGGGASLPSAQVGNMLTALARRESPLRPRFAA